MLHQFDDVESDRVGQGEQFDNVDAPLAGFGLCDPRLKVPHTASEFALIEFCRGSFFRQKLHQVAVQFGVNRPHSTGWLSNYRIIPNPDQTAIFMPISTICKGTTDSDFRDRTPQGAADSGDQAAGQIRTRRAAFFVGVGNEGLLFPPFQLPLNGIANEVEPDFLGFQGSVDSGQNLIRQRQHNARPIKLGAARARLVFPMFSDPHNFICTLLTSGWQHRIYEFVGAGNPCRCL
jgi:hypothetical protein